MRSRRGSLAAAAAMALIASSIVSAQIGGKPVTGNPTPGTAQPDPPNLADRITVVGCLRSVPADRSRRAEASTSAKAPADKSASAVDPNAPSAARYELVNAQRENRVPEGTGGSPLAAAASSKSYRLEGIDSQFSPFVGAKVEISGEIKPASANPPTLLVGFVQRLAARCS